MKKTLIPVLAAAAAATLSGAEKHEPDIIVYMHNANEKPAIISSAERQAQDMLAAVGITAAWSLAKPHYDGRAEVIEAVLTNQPDDTVRPGALACATLGPQSGTRIEVFYNRVLAHAPDAGVATILAHVLVHEITHVLEGINRHSGTGVMKARWDTADWRQMKRLPLPFADEDIRLIHAWAASRHAVLLAGLR